jgi:hypothetical protein
MAKNNIITEEELRKLSFLDKVLNFDPSSKKRDPNAEFWVQYTQKKGEHTKYTYTITNHVTAEENNNNKIFVISGSVKDLSSRVEGDHESRMIASLCERSIINDKNKATKNELLVVNYNKALFMDNSRKSVKTLFNHTFRYLFYNEKEITKTRVENILSHETTVISIIDENPKQSITSLVRSTKSMIEFPDNNSTIENNTQRDKSHVAFIKQSNMTKGWSIIKKNIEKYPSIADHLGKSKEEIDTNVDMYSMADTLSVFCSQFSNRFGNNMEKPKEIETVENNIKELIESLAKINIVSDMNLDQSKNGLNSNNKRVKEEEETDY